MSWDVRASRRLIISGAAALALAALVGYLVGHSHTASASSERTRSLLVGGVLVSASRDWQLARSSPPIPGLAMTNPADLAPGGNAAKAGLISGQLPSGGPTPLPASFLAHVARLPQTEVVSLLEVQAYRYSQLNVGGFAGALVVYVVPSPGGRPTAAACYAAQGFLAEMQVCERIIATLTLVEHPHTYDLTPEPGYARQLSDVIAGLEQRRVSLRRAIHEGDAPAAAEGPAQGLANAFTQTAASLSVLEPPLVASQDQALLDRSVARAGDGYSALVAALSSESPSDYDAARAQIDEAEASVDSALEGLTLLGYQAGAPAS